MAKVATKEILSDINKIGELNAQIKEIVSTMPECAIKKAFEYSVSNVEKKVQRFTTPSSKMILDDEEKAIIAAFRAKKEAEGKGTSTEGEKDAVSTHSGTVSDDKKTSGKKRH